MRMKIKKTMKIFVLSFLFAASLVIQAQETIRGEGRFVSRDEDSLDFVKEQLLFNALRDVVDKELSSMGLDSGLFWRELDQRFEKSFENKLNEIREKYGIKTSDDDSSVDFSDLSSNQIEAYQKELRQTRLKERVRHARLERLIPSYSIERMSRSSHSPNSRFLALNARVNRELLTSTYYDFTRTAEGRFFSNLFLTTDFSLVQTIWPDLGVNSEGEFVNVINRHWHRWLNENFVSFIDNIIITDDALEEKLSNYSETSSFLQSSIPQQNVSEDSLDSFIDTSLQTKSEYADSLWLKFTVEISKINDRNQNQQRDFEIRGEFILIDLKTNQVLQYYDFPLESRTFSTYDSHRLSSELASLIYRMPMARLDRLSREFNSITSKKNVVSLNLSDVKTIEDLFLVSNALSSRGIPLRLESKPRSYGGGQGVIDVYFEGTNQDVIDILHSMNMVELENNRRVILPRSENPFALSLQAENE